MQRLQFFVSDAYAGMRLNVFLRTMGVSAACIKAVKYQGEGFFVSQGGAEQPVHTDCRVRPGQTIVFTLPPEPPTSVRPEPVPVHLVYQDEFAAVLDKPAGMAVHPTLNHPGGTLANGWMYRLREQGEQGVFRPVNRIDKNTSGLVLCARSAFAAPGLARTARKCYLALAEGSVPQPGGRIDAPIARCGDSIIGRCVRPDGKPSVTDYTVLARSETHSLLACFPVTGRTHQIRVHMAWAGYPLAGDTLYGGSTKIMARHALHCAVVSFERPGDGTPRRVQSLPPQDFADACAAAGLPQAEELAACLTEIYRI